LSVEDLDKKIGDLKAVEAWLNVNMSMLRATIQGLEVQRGTMATLKSLGASFAAAVQQPETAEKSLWESPYASAFFQHAKAPPADAPAGAAQMDNSAVWWNMLQDQFTQAVSSAMSPEAVASATAMASEAAAQAAAQFAAAAGAAPANGHDDENKPAAKTKPVKTGKN
jgi:hypothetical protein